MEDEMKNLWEREIRNVINMYEIFLKMSAKVWFFMCGYYSFQGLNACKQLQIINNVTDFGGIRVA